MSRFVEPRHYVILLSVVVAALGAWGLTSLLFVYVYGGNNGHDVSLAKVVWLSLGCCVLAGVALGYYCQRRIKRQWHLSVQQLCQAAATAGVDLGSRGAAEASGALQGVAQQLAAKLRDCGLQQLQFQKWAAYSSEAVACLDMPHWRLGYVNPTFAGCLDKSPDQLQGEAFLNLWPQEELRQQWEQNLYRCWQQGQVQEVTLPLLADTTEIRWRLLPLALQGEEPARVLLVGCWNAKDQQALQEQERLLEAITAAARDAIVVVDDEDRVVLWNKAATHLLGYLPEEIQGQQLHQQVMPQELWPRFQKAFNAFAETGTGTALGSVMELEALHKEGFAIPVEISLAAVMLHQHWYAVGILRDVSERRQREAYLQEAKERAEAAARSKSQFLANMSHEIRTPMNGILGMADLLQGSSLTQEQQESVDVIRESAQALLRVLNDVLDFSKLEAGQLQLQRKPLQLSRLLDQVQALYEEQARKQGLVFAVDLDEQLPQWVLGDLYRLRQVLLNLVGNALKFTPEGSVTLRVKGVNSNLLLCFEVADTGIGIAKNAQDALFEAFSQVDSSAQRPYGGTGLGLSISRELVHLMGGEIGVQSQLGSGSTFWFTIPLVPAQAPEEAREAQAQPSTVARRGSEVLLVEDNLVNQKVAARMLEKEGMRVTVADNGMKALEFAQQQAYDLVFMDIEMPDMDGFETTKRLRDLGLAATEPDVPIVAMTAHAMSGDRQRCLSAGMDDYISKPVSLQQLQQILATWLPPQAQPQPEPQHES